jgi:hypothetical protein
VFLVNLPARYVARGYSPTSFQVRMSHEDIGNYLGLTTESISRLLLRFKKLGLLQVDKREVMLLEPAPEGDGRRHRAVQPTEPNAPAASVVRELSSARA